jgi:hypothetical protein
VVCVKFQTCLTYPFLVERSHSHRYKLNWLINSLTLFQIYSLYSVEYFGKFIMNGEGLRTLKETTMAYFENFV